MGKYRKYNNKNTVSDKLRHLGNQGINPVEAVVTAPNLSNYELLYCEFVAWAQYKNINPDVFRYIYKRYYDEFIGGL